MGFAPERHAAPMIWKRVATGNGVDVNRAVAMTGGTLDYAAPFTLSGGTLIHIQDSQGSQGSEVLTFAPAKIDQSLAFSSPLLVAGETYIVFAGGTYTPGVEAASFTVESVVT